MVTETRERLCEPETTQLTAAAETPELHTSLVEFFQSD